MVELKIKNRTEKYQLQPSKIIALGLNYHEHINESHSVKVQGFTKEAPKEPLLFPKTPNVLIGHDEPIIIPEFLKDYKFEDQRTDYEAEMAIIIKKPGKDIPEVDAYEHILGFTCMNDVSQRNLQTGERSGWFRGKSLDTFGPIGPQLVLMEDIGDPQALDIQCRLNGEVVQKSNTKYMIFNLKQIIAFISRNFKLETGDIIVTGTPGGVGRLHDGDVVEIEIENIGILRNSVIDKSK